MAKEEVPTGSEGAEIIARRNFRCFRETMQSAPPTPSLCVSSPLIRADFPRGKARPNRCLSPPSSAEMLNPPRDSMPVTF